MGTEIVFTNVSKKYNNEYAVKDLNFEVKSGEMFALLGPSGAGKTTSLNLLAGLTAPDEGDILINGSSYKDVKSQDRNFAMVFESYALYPHLTVEENMSFPLKAPNRKSNYTDDQIKKIVEEKAEILGIKELLHRYPKELSGGQQQRVGLGRVLVRNPKLFLLDEPIAHLDAKLRTHMRGQLKKMHKANGITTILATPDFNEVLAMADRVAILHEGEIQQIGSPLELYNRPANEIVATTIGDPPMNLIECTLVEDDGFQCFKGDGFSIQLEKANVDVDGLTRDVKLGVRPNDITIELNCDNGDIVGTCYVFEPLGDKGIATINLGDSQIKVVCPPKMNFQINQKVGLNINFDNISIFNAETGEAIYN